MFEYISTTVTNYIPAAEALEKYSFFQNTLLSYVLAVGVALAAMLFFWIIQRIVIAWLKTLSKRTKTDIDDTVIAIAESIRPSFYFVIALYLGLLWLELPSVGDTIITAVFLITIAVQAVFVIQRLIDYVVERRERRENDPNTTAAFRYLANIAKWSLWIIAILMVLSNLGINVTSVLAGVGIAGIAIGFALQNILGDLFSSFAIYFDKPFQVGDFIEVGDDSGNVEKIGIKTTRIRTLRGEELIMSNQELTSARINNFKKLKERRVTFHIGVLYETPFEKVKKIPTIIGDIIEKQGKARVDRVHFSSFGDSALVFEIVYYVLSDAYLDKMNVQQEIQFEIMKVFEKEKIEFAYPTQTLYVKK